MHQNTYKRFEQTLLDFAGAIADTPLESLTDEAAFEPLVALLHSCELDSNQRTDEKLRIHIAIHLLHFGVIAVPSLLAYVRKEPCADEFNTPGYPLRDLHAHTTSRYVIVEHLGDHNYAGTFDGLLQLFTVCRNHFVVEYLAVSLMKIDPQKALPSIAHRLLTDNTTAIRLSIAKVLQEHPHPDSMFSLIIALKDPTPQIASLAALALGKLKLPAAFPFLLNALLDMSSTDTSLQQNIHLIDNLVTAIQTYDTEEARHVVLEWAVDALWNDNLSIEVIAIKQLGELKENRAIPYLIEYYHRGKTKPVSLSYSIKEALSTIDTPEAHAALKMLNNPVP